MPIGNVEPYAWNEVWEQFSETLRIIQSYIKQNNIAKGFRPNQDDYAFAATEPSFPVCMANLHGEVSEAWEAWREHGLEDTTRTVGEPIVTGSRKGESPGMRVRGHNPPKPEGVGSELADVMIRLLDTADIFNIDLAAEVRRKMQYNTTRPYRHGDKLA
jgi:NTP pyrophosphatase (non-canonical NTP hydrolase)